MGHAPRNLELTDLSELVRQSVESHLPQAAAMDHTLTMKGEQPLSTIPLERHRMTQVVNNLLTNAIKYTPAGGLITVATEATPGMVGFSVTDTGAGMSAEDTEQIFSPFFRTRSATQSGVIGAGLGLALSRSIVEAHGGHITVKTSPGHGTEISVRLPLPTLDGTV